MKNITLSIIATILLICQATAQTVNWSNFTQEQKHIINIHGGLNYAFIAGVGYDYKLNLKKIPFLLHAEYSAPFGKKPMDDFKAKLGGQVQMLNVNNFSLTIGVHGLYRRYQSKLGRLAGFGSEFSAAFGFYRPKWYTAGELIFDKAIITHIKHSSIMKENYTAAQDGWYMPTGGNFSYGLRSGLSVKNNDVYLKIGKTITQDLKTSPIIPYYCIVGINMRLK